MVIRMGADLQADFTELRDLALSAARAGGIVALEHFRRQDLTVDWKPDDSPVTQADREAEATIRATIRAARPHDGWLGEETGSEDGSTGLSWIVDPVDGTRNFVRGVPLWATLVACVHEVDGRLRSVAGAVSIPALKEDYVAVRGGGAHCSIAGGDPMPVQVSTIDTLADALWCFETPAWFRDHGLGAVYERLTRCTHLQRGLCDAYGHMLVASGRAEAIVEPSLSVWDVAASSLIVEEAGGRFTDLRGTERIDAGNAIVSNGRVHEELLELVRNHRDG